MTLAADAAMKRSGLSAVVVAGLAVSFGYALPALAQGAAKGPVATQCASEIKTYCADKQHGQGAIRACLEAKRSQLSAECTKALDTTGGGKGRNRSP